MEWIVSLTPNVGPGGLDKPPEGATVVEVRGDLLPDLDPAQAVARSAVPVLYTLRSTAEGGRGPVDPAERLRRLAAARDAGVALLDLEAERDRHLIAELGLNPARIILSWHDPHGTPEDLERRARNLLSLPAGLVKVVVTPRSFDDLERLLRLGRELNRSRHRKRLIAFGMGALGLPSRYLAPLLGPRIAYAAWKAGAAAAPGQVPLSRLRAAIGHLEGPPNRLFAVVGADVSRSLSPVLHAGGYTAAGIHGVMVPVNVPQKADLGRFFVPAGSDVFARAVGIPLGGLAVTAPWKAAAMAAATLASPRARRARAANTLVPGPDRLLADTTDADGIRGAVAAAGIDPFGKVAVIQGTGGAARGAAVGLDIAGCRVLLRGRDAGRTRETAESVGVDWLGPSEPAPAGALLVNATPLGSREGDPLPFGPDELRNAAAVVDMVYRLDGPTDLESLATTEGTACAGGAVVLLQQAVPQFAAMTGTVPPREAMEAALAAFAPLSGSRPPGEPRP